MPQQFHRSRNEDAADQGRIQKYRHRQTETHLLHHNQVTQGKPAEYRDHYQSGTRYQPTGRTEAERNCFRVVIFLLEPLTHPTQQENMVIHREPEEKGKEE